MKKVFIPIMGLLLLVLGLATVLIDKEPIDKQVASADPLQEIRNEREIRPAFEHLYDMMKNQETGLLDMKDMIKEQEQVKAMAQLKSTSALETPIQWDELGPNNVGGRCRALVIDREDDQTLYAGSVTGGIFKSTDGGNNWDFLSSSVEAGAMTISTMVQAENGTLYIGTGTNFEFIGGSSIFGTFFPGSGMFKSEDGGETFEALSATTPSSASDSWSAINRIASQTVDGNTIVYAGSGGGLFVSTDGGATFQPAKDQGGTILPQQVVYDVQIGSDGKVVTFIGSRLFKSTDDQGLVYEQLDGIEGGFPSNKGGRKVVTVSPADPNYIYIAVTTGQGCTDGVWQSTDGGDTFDTIGEASALFDPAKGGTGADANCQGDYDWCIAADPNNPTKIYLGGISLWTWSEASGWTQVDKYWGDETDPQYIHPDKQGLFYHPTNSDILYNTNDGGVYVTNNASSDYPLWQAKNRGFNALQCYSISAGHNGFVMAGAQDNGTQLLRYNFNSAMTADEVGGGDGGYSEISNIDPNFLFGATQNGNLRRFTNGGEGFPGCILSTNSDPDFPSNNNPYSSLLTGSECAVNEGSMFIHAFHLWEETKLYHQVTDWQPTATITNPDTILRVVTYENGQTFAITTDEDKYAVLYDDIYNYFDTIFVGFDIVEQKIIENPNDDRFRRARYFTGSLAGRLWMTEDPLKPGKTPEWVDLTHSAINSAGQNTRAGGPGTAFGTSKDGDMVVMGTGNGRLLRVTGLNGTGKPVIKLVQPNNLVGRYISSVSVDQINAGRVVVTTGNYGNVSNVYESLDFNLPNPTFTDIQGNLPNAPVYDGEILLGVNTFAGNVQGDLLVGTRMGVFYGTKVGTTYEWEEQNTGLGRVPVFALRQEPMANYEPASNFFVNVVYVGVHGRGMFRTTTLTDKSASPDVYSIPTFTPDEAGSLGLEDIGHIESIKVFPNPMQGQANIQFTLEEKANVMVNIYDVQGRLVVQKEAAQLNAGPHQYQINRSELTAGNFIVTVETDQQKMSAKLVVLR